MARAGFVVFGIMLLVNSVAQASYYTGREKCIIENRPSAFEIGDKIAYGEPIASKYEYILEGDDFNPNEDVLEPMQVAYAMYVISERIGDTRGAARQRWAEPYMDMAKKDKVISAIYRKYSASYLYRCFSISSEESYKTPAQDSNYQLYIYGQ